MIRFRTLTISFILIFTFSCSDEDNVTPLEVSKTDTIISSDSNHFSHFTLSRYTGNTNSYFYFDIPGFVFGYNYRIDFNGEGNYQQVVRKSIQDVQIKRVGTFDVRMLTIDKEGNIYSYKRSVTITDINDRLGNFLDTRDNKNYQTTKIGNQVWFAENVSYNEVNSKVNGIYGRLYHFDEACKVCPSGWHLPETWEVDTLLANLKDFSFPATVVLKKDSVWGTNLKANNESGFAALPGGSYHGYNSIGYIQQGDKAIFWTNNFNSIGSSGYSGKPLIINNNNDALVYDRPSSLGYRPFYSVRCVKD